MKHRRFLAITALIIFPLFMWGCPFSTDPGDGGGGGTDPVYVPQTSAKNVLANLQTSYENRNFDEYIKLFTTDFTFVFNPLDAADDTLDIPVSWGLEEERDAHRGLFDAIDVDAIRLEWTLDPEEVSSLPDIADTQIDARNVFLEVATRLQNGETLFLQAQGDALFFFRKTDDVNSGNDTIWAISRWEDRTLRAGQ